MLIFLLIIAALVGALLFYANKVQIAEEKHVSAMTPEDRAKYQDERAAFWKDREARHREEQAALEHGMINPHFICPHCQTKGSVRSKAVRHKTGISGGKATAALLTLGTSVVATGLSRKENRTKA